MMGDLYAVVEDRPEVWAVVGFAEGVPQLVPIGRWNIGGDNSWMPVAVRAGAVWVPTHRDTVIYAPDYGSLIQMQMEAAEDGA